MGEESGRLQMFAYGVVHIGTIEFSQLGINNVSFFDSAVLFHATSAVLQLTLLPLAWFT